MHRRCISNPLLGFGHRSLPVGHYVVSPCVVGPTRQPAPRTITSAHVTTPSIAQAQTSTTANGTGKELATQQLPFAPVSTSASPQPTASHPQSATAANSTEPPPPISTQAGFQLKAIHVVMFSLIFFGGAVFATITLQLTVGMEFSTAISTVLRRVSKSVAFRQLLVISGAILVLRYGMNNFLMSLSKFSSNPVQWDKTKLYYILREVYQPMELLLFIAALCTVADAYVPSLIGVPKATVQHVVKSILSTSFILGFASVVFNLKSRFCKENAWQAEMKGDVTTQRRWEAYDKLGTFVIYVMSFVLGIQALGLEVTSVLAIGGIGGLAIGLAGREICENLLNGFLIMSTSPFEVGDEITFFHNNKVVEGFVIDIGWYRTNVRSFEREVYVIPNAVFSKNIVLNVSRKNREWRFNEMLSIRVQDIQKANTIVQDIRRIVRNDTRVINKLHRRAFLDKITPDDAKIYLSFYLEAANRDAFMAIKQDLLVSFVDCVERNGAKLAMPRTVVDLDPEMADALNSMGPLVQGMGAYAAMAQNLSAAGPVDNGMAGRWALPTDTSIIAAEATPVVRSSPPPPPPPAPPAATSNASGGAPQPVNAPVNVPAVVQPAMLISAPAVASSASSSGIGSSGASQHASGHSTSNTAGHTGAGTSVSGGTANGSGVGSGGGGGGGSINGKSVSSHNATGSAPTSTSVSSVSSSGGGGGGGSGVTAYGPSGTRVGEVFTAPQSTLVVSVPATGVPIAFAGAVTNNVVATGANRPPLSASSTSSTVMSSVGGSSVAVAMSGGNGHGHSSTNSNSSNSSSTQQQQQPLSVASSSSSSGNSSLLQTTTGTSLHGPKNPGVWWEGLMRTMASLVFESPTSATDDKRHQ